MPSNSKKPTRPGIRVRKIVGTAPRKGTYVAWPEGKPPGGKLPSSAKPKSGESGSE